MTLWVQLVCVAALAAGCGGPPVGSKVPKANTKKMAIGAAAAATAITLIDPKSANRKPEMAEEQEPKKVKKTGESVPAGVLDRLDKNAEEDDDCADVKPDGDDNSVPPPPDNAAVPKVVNETRETRERERRKKCLDDPPAEE